MPPYAVEDGLVTPALTPINGLRARPYRRPAALEYWFTAGFQYLCAPRAAYYLVSAVGRWGSYDRGLTANPLIGTRRIGAEK